VPLKNNFLLSPWQRIIKRAMDLLVSVTGLILLSPLIIYVALRVMFSSPGNIIYTQERIGYKGKKFNIRKFRSMFVNAESSGPGLSQKNDVRITEWGRTMRKWKLDELPQLWNVFAGDMSLVGPRPERPHYIGMLAQKGVSYEPLLQLKPGITSLGMVRFGYASTVEEIIERMKYDLYYLENFSLSLDVKIMLSTLRIIFMAKGR
jgi:lipopolysaccharide/colanic/teichoic acid biosynthesis glycosyltransferase